MFRVLAFILLATTTIVYGISWNGNWATSCDFIGNELTNSLSTRKDCADRCASTVGCTHYTWTNYNDGTCWMKKNSVSKNNAVPKHDQGAICGVIVANADRAFTGVVTGAVDGVISGTADGLLTGGVDGILTGTADGLVTGVADGLVAGAVGGGVIIDSVGGVISANVSGVIASGINWNGKNWAVSCQFIGNDLTNSLTSAKDCGGCCAATPGCTHYTWTNYNGGTCWMKKNSVSKRDAVPKHDQGAVCGVSVNSVGGAITGSVSGVIASGINWNGKSWAASCQFIGNDLTNALTRAKDCGGLCAATLGCTHYTWTNYKGGTCWMKKNSVSKSDAVPRHNQGAICGVVIKSAEGAATASESGVIASGINWNGKNWAASCQFIGNDLANALTRAKDCGGRCASTPGCTHYTWTNYNGGTCWMKKNSASKSDAVPKYDQGAVCGVTISNAGVGGVDASGINWNGNNGASSCGLLHNYLTNVPTRTEDCGWQCMPTFGCTHYPWNNYNDRSCWMKRNSEIRIDVDTKRNQGIDYFGRPLPSHNQIIINLV